MATAIMKQSRSKKHTYSSLDTAASYFAKTHIDLPRQRFSDTVFYYAMKLGFHSISLGL